MIKEDLWCGYCGTQDFKEYPDDKHPNDSRYSQWECLTCEAIYELNEGYGYYTIHWGRNDLSKGGTDKYSLGTGALMDESKLPRTPEGIVRHSDSKEKLKAYLDRTQIK